jgi:AcrR family transcriptional regulator
LSNAPVQTPPRKRLTAAARRELIELAATGLFAERGYHHASMEEIARRSGVSVPVVYEHFRSKQDLHRRLLERHFAELRALWAAHLPADVPFEERLPRALDAWFAYVQSHPYAWRMLFADTSGDPEVQAIHREVAAGSRARLMPLLAREPGSAEIAGSGGLEALDMLWEVLRSVLQGLALWWYEHQHVPRERVLETAMNALWIGYERVLRGELWQPQARAEDGRQ